MKKNKKIILVLLVLFVVMQFFRIDKSTPEIEETKDFISITNPSVEVKTILINACYDCHSFETKYPWYSEVAPISWWTKDHVNEGREELNFSLWGEYSAKKADHKLEESIEEVEAGEMPLVSYTLIHGEAKLTNDQRMLLKDFFNGLRDFSSEGEEHNHVH